MRISFVSKPRDHLTGVIVLQQSLLIHFFWMQFKTCTFPPNTLIDEFWKKISLNNMRNLDPEDFSVLDAGSAVAEVKPSVNISSRGLSSRQSRIVLDAWGRFLKIRKFPWAMAICQWIEIEPSPHWGRDRRALPTSHVGVQKGGNPFLDNIHGIPMAFLFLIIKFIPQSMLFKGSLFIYNES